MTRIRDQLVSDLREQATAAGLYTRTLLLRAADALATLPHPTGCEEALEEAAVALENHMKDDRHMVTLRNAAAIVRALKSPTEASASSQTKPNSVGSPKPTTSKGQKAMVDKSKLRVFDAPFSTTVTGVVKVLATDAKGAAEALNAKLEDGSFGWDNNNLAEEGIIHDGSIYLASIIGGEIEGDEDTIKETTDKPEEHPDWDAFEDAGDGIEEENDGDMPGTGEDNAVDMAEEAAKNK